MTGTERSAVDDASGARIWWTRTLAATKLRAMTVPVLVNKTLNDSCRDRDSGCNALVLATSPVPVAVDNFTISMLWHASFDHDPVRRWLRGIVSEVGRDFAGALFEAPTG